MLHEQVISHVAQKTRNKLHLSSTINNKVFHDYVNICLCKIIQCNYAHEIIDPFGNLFPKTNRHCFENIHDFLLYYKNKRTKNDETQHI